MYPAAYPGARQVALVHFCGTITAVLMLACGQSAIAQKDDKKKEFPVAVGKEVMVGDLGITVVSVLEDRLIVATFGGGEIDNKTRLVVRLRYRNANPKKLIDVPSLVAAATAKDSEDNELRESVKDYAKQISKGNIVTIRSDEKAEDVLVFERPATAANGVEVRIDASKYPGGQGTLVLTAKLGEKEPLPKPKAWTKDWVEGLVLGKGNADVTTALGGTPDKVEVEKGQPTRWRYKERGTPPADDKPYTDVILAFDNKGKVSSVELKTGPATKVMVDVAAVIKDLKDTDENTRQLAAELAADLQDDLIATALCAAAYDPSAKVSKAALRSLEKVRPELHKRFSTLLSDTSYINRRKAIDEIALMGANGRPAVPSLAVIAAMPFPTTSTTSGQRDVIEGAVLAINSLGISDEVVAEVLAKVATGRASPPSRTAAVQALENWAKEGKGSEKQLFVVLRAWFGINEDYQVRACEVAGRQGEKGRKEFADTLTKLTQSKSQKVQEAAKAALELLNK